MAHPLLFTTSMSGWPRTLGPSSPTSSMGYTVTSGALHDQLGVSEHRAIEELLDRAVDPREVDTLPVEQRVAQFRGRAREVYLPAPLRRVGSGDQLRAALEATVAKLEGTKDPALEALRAGLREILDEHRSIASARAGGAR